MDSLPQVTLSQTGDSTPLPPSSPPAKRGRGRPKGSITRNRRPTSKQINALMKLGRTPKEIQDELGISRNTVEATLAADSRARLFEMLPVAERAVKRQLEKGDGSLGIRLIEAAGVLTNEAPRFSFHDDAKLQLIVQNLTPKGMVAVPAEPKPDAVEGEVVDEPGRHPVAGPDSGPNGEPDGVEAEEGAPA